MSQLRTDIKEAQTFTENTIFMTERLGLMVEEAQTFRENHIKSIN